MLQSMPASCPAHRTDAAEHGFSPEANGLDNLRSLQRAVDGGGTVVVSRPGVYRLAGTVLIGSHTTLVFANGVTVMKSLEQGEFSHVLLNQGALDGTWNEGIVVEGLTLAVNGIDVRKFLVFGLHGQVAFLRVRDLRIQRFRCLDLGKAQYGIHVCTFEDLVVDDVIIHGDKDGVHLGRGRRFRISNAVFRTHDDAIALNAHDYDVGNPELGWIEDGVVENCVDLDAERTTGFFCRILAGAWTDWFAGMVVRKSDTVVSQGRLYRVRAEPDRATYRSATAPVHERGSAVVDGITWTMVQEDVTRTAGVRDVVFRDIRLHKARTAFSIHFDNDHYSRSYYPGAPLPVQQRLAFDNVRVLHDRPCHFLSSNTPVDALLVANSWLGNSQIVFNGIDAIADYGRTAITLVGCAFTGEAEHELVVNTVPNKTVVLHTAGSLVLHPGYAARVSPGPGTITIDSDLPGLQAG